VSWLDYLHHKVFQLRTFLGIGWIEILQDIKYDLIQGLTAIGHIGSLSPYFIISIFANLVSLRSFGLCHCGCDPPLSLPLHLLHWLTSLFYFLIGFCVPIGRTVSEQPNCWLSFTLAPSLLEFPLLYYVSPK